MSLYLAIDAGGTKTECLLADDRRILARASTGTVKLMRVSEEEATARLQSILEKVASVANVSLGGVTRTCFGLAGVSSPPVRAWAHQIVPAMVAGEFLLVGDEEIALAAAFKGGPGILVIAGTGSNIIGRDSSGKLFGAGGWGPVLGDEGSGYWIGLEALRAALRAQDRIGLDGISSCLLRDIEVHWELDSVAELVAMANLRSGARRPAPDFASLAPVVARCAEDGDALAAGVLERAGEELADQVILVYRKMTARPATRKLTLAGSPPAPTHSAEALEIGVAYTGSVLAQITPVRTAMIARLAASLPTARVGATPVDPLEGALWRARRD
jgi:glucosamine kinase